MMIQSRDLVQKRIIMSNFSKESTDKLILFKSVEHKDYPFNNQYSRATTLISGYYIKEIDQVKSIIYVISQTDFGGSIPKFLVNSVSSKAPKEWIMNLIKGCKIAKSSKEL